MRISSRDINVERTASIFSVARYPRSRSPGSQRPPAHRGVRIVGYHAHEADWSRSAHMCIGLRPPPRWIRLAYKSNRRFTPPRRTMETLPTSIRPESPLTAIAAAFRENIRARLVSRNSSRPCCSTDQKSFTCALAPLLCPLRPVTSAASSPYSRRRRIPRPSPICNPFCENVN